MIRNVKNFAIRLSLLFISVIGIYFCNNVNAETIQNCYTIENERTRQCETILPGEISTYNGEYNTISNIWNFDNNDLKVLWLKSAGGNNLNMGLFWNNGKLYNIWDYAWLNPATGIGETKYVCKVNSTDYQDIGQYCGLTACGNNDNRCNIYGLKNYTTPIETFIEDTNIQTPTEYIIMYSTNASSRGPRICAKYDSFSYCIAVNPYYIKSYKSDIMTIIDQGVASQGETLTYYSNMYENSPFGSSGGSNNSDNSLIYTQGNDLDNTISYFENQFGWNVNMCYVGTNNLTGVYGTAGIDFQYGQGDTIFGLFNSVYGGFGDNIIQNVGRFINTWLINYSQWFATAPGNRLYLAKYDGPGNNVTYYYTGLSFPYANQPVAIYFMSDLLFNEYSNESTLGESMAYYCYLKFNYNELKSGTGSQTFEDVQNMVTPGIVGRINDYVNVYLSGHVGFLVPDLSGSVWGDVSSGSVFDGDVDPSNTFEGFYNDILGIVNRGNYSGSGILPPRIIYPLLFLILFRILKH